MTRSANWTEMRQEGDKDCKASLVLTALSLLKNSACALIKVEEKMYLKNWNKEKLGKNVEKVIECEWALCYNQKQENCIIFTD